MPADPDRPASDAPRDGAGGAMGRVSLAGVRCLCHIGVTEEERRERQRIEVDLDLYADLEQAGRTADLARTIDYQDVADRVRALLEGRPWHLVEAAAVAILDLVFERWRPARRAVVRVRKYVLRDVVHVEIEMERTR
jgi:dihydroneopterin aldolase